MITIEQVIEQCALEAVCLRDDLLQSDGKFNEGQMFAAEEIATRIRALAEQYEGCIVAEGEVRMKVPTMNGYRNLYRAREAK